MPTLTTNESLNGLRSYEYTEISTGVTTKGNDLVRVSAEFSRTKTGNWDRKKPVVRPLPPSPYTLSQTSFRHAHLEHFGKKPNGPYMERYWGVFSGSYPYTWAQPNLENDLRNEALLDALSNLKDQRFNAGVAIAEAGGVARMAEDVLSGVIAVRRKFIKGQFKAAYAEYKRRFKSLDWEDETGKFVADWQRFKRIYSKSLSRSHHLSKVPNAWLYYHFGIKPTVQDVQSAVEDWKRRNDTRPENWTNIVRGRAKNVVIRNELAPYDIFDRSFIAFKEHQSFRVVMPVVPKNDFLVRLAQMGVTNVPEAVWNAVPFSWVGDYFTSFGDWLSALDAGMGYDFGQLVESYRCIRTAKCSSFANSSNPSVPYGNARVLIPYKHRSLELKRRLPTTFYPPMYRTLPRIKLKGPSVQRISNMLSVLPGLFGGNPSRHARH